MSYISDLYLPLPRQEMIKAVEHHSPTQIPLVQARWWGEGLEEQCGAHDTRCVLDEWK